jgi:uncharacterized protein YhaN
MNNEVKRVVANPEEEEACIQHYQEWGWVLKFRNEVLAKDMHFDSATMVSFGRLNLGKVNSHEEVTHFVSMLFERDLSNPKIARLAALETEIPALEKKAKDLKKASDKAQKDHQGKVAIAESDIDDIDHWKRKIISGSIIGFLGLGGGITCFLLYALCAGSEDWKWGGAALLIFGFLPGLFFLICGLQGHARRFKREEYVAKLEAVKANHRSSDIALSKTHQAEEKLQAAQAEAANLRGSL